MQSGWESWELPCRRLGAAATASSPSHGFYCLGYCEGREGGEEEKEPHNFACVPAAAPRPRCALALPSLHNALAGGALPGLLPCCRRRAPGTPAAGRRRRLRVRPGLLRGGARRRGGKGKPVPPLQMPARSSGRAAPSPLERTAWKSIVGRSLSKWGCFKGGGRICWRRRGAGGWNIKIWVFRVAGRKVARGTTAFTKNRKIPDRRGAAQGLRSGRGAGAARRGAVPAAVPAAAPPFAAERGQGQRPAGFPGPPGPGSWGAARGGGGRLGTGEAAGSCGGEGCETLWGAGVHRSGAAGGGDDNKTRDFPFVAKSLGVIDTVDELLLRDGVDGR